MQKSSYYFIRDMRIGSNHAMVKRIVFFIAVACCFFVPLMAQESSNSTIPIGNWVVNTDSAEYVINISGNNEYSIKSNPKDMGLYYELKGTAVMGRLADTEAGVVVFKECKTFSSAVSGSKLKEEIVNQTIDYLIRNLPRFGVPIDDFDSQLKVLAEYLDNVSSKYKSAVQEINGHIAVDLGLSVKWATCNVGAKYSADFGYDLPWGITGPDMPYSDRYQGQSYILPLKWDAANQNWGGDWRMPSHEELNELNTKCTWKFLRQGNVGVFRVTGPNGNSIILPMAGNSGRGGGCYWSSNRSGSGDEAYGIRCFVMEGKEYHEMCCDYCSNHFNIRPVIK